MIETPDPEYYEEYGSTSKTPILGDAELANLLEAQGLASEEAAKVNYDAENNILTLNGVTLPGSVIAVYFQNGVKATLNPVNDNEMQKAITTTGAKLTINQEDKDSTLTIEELYADKNSTIDIQNAKLFAGTITSMDDSGNPAGEIVFNGYTELMGITKEEYTPVVVDGYITSNASIYNGSYALFNPQQAGWESSYYFADGAHQMICQEDEAEPIIFGNTPATVTLVTNGGSLANTSVNIYTPHKTALLDAGWKNSAFLESRPGYTFGGWYFDSDFTRFCCGLNARNEVVYGGITKTCTLYAKWIPEEDMPEQV